MGSVPGMYNSSSLIQNVLRRLSSPDLLTEAGMRSMSSKDPMYDKGYHTGQVWPLMTGWHAIACYNNDLQQTGFKCLKTFMDLAFSAQDPGRIAFSAQDPGRINETYDAETFEPEGQFAQVWSHSLFIQGVLEGLLNMIPQWRTDMIPVLSVVNRLPREINFIEVKNLLFQGSVFNIAINQGSPPTVEKESLK
jgi:glycogen debranching enzyme